MNWLSGRCGRDGGFDSWTGGSIDAETDGDAVGTEPCFGAVVALYLAVAWPEGLLASSGVEAEEEAALAFWGRSGGEGYFGWELGTGGLPAGRVADFGEEGEAF